MRVVDVGGGAGAFGVVKDAGGGAYALYPASGSLTLHTQAVAVNNAPETLSVTGATDYKLPLVNPVNMRSEWLRIYPAEIKLDISLGVKGNSASFTTDVAIKYGNTGTASDPTVYNISNLALSSVGDSRSWIAAILHIPEAGVILGRAGANASTGGVATEIVTTGVPTTGGGQFTVWLRNTSAAGRRMCVGGVSVGLRC